METSFIPRIAVYGSRRQGENTALVRKLMMQLVFMTDEISMHYKLYDYLAEQGAAPVGVRRVAECPSDTGMVLSIGGDGTFLRTVAWASTCPEAPVLGINTGHLGYLTAMTIDEAIESGEELLSFRSLRSEKLAMLSVEVPGIDNLPEALNEVVLAKEDSASVITASALMDGSPLADYKADGLIVATPTGSTAYNLSVGGPIVQPSAPVIVISPIAAHSLTLRPLVVNDQSRLNVRVTGRGRHFRLVIDGRSYSLPMGQEVGIARSRRTVTILLPRDRDFARIIGSKLLFNV